MNKAGKHWLSSGGYYWHKECFFQVGKTGKSVLIVKGSFLSAVVSRVGVESENWVHFPPSQNILHMLAFSN